MHTQNCLFRALECSNWAHSDLDKLMEALFSISGRWPGLEAAWRGTEPSPGAGSPSPASGPSLAGGVGGLLVVKRCVKQNMQGTLLCLHSQVHVTVWIKRIKNLNMKCILIWQICKKYALTQGPTLLMVPQCLAAASGRGSDSDGCDVSPVTVVAILLQWLRLWRLVLSWVPTLDEDQALMFTLSELRLYRQAQDHRTRGY